MKTIKSIILIAALLVAGFFMNACFDDFDAEFNDDPQVAFAHSMPGGQFSATVNVPLDGTAEYTMRVQLIGPHQGTSVNVSFGTDTENSSAIEGDHFTYVQGNSTEIPANESFGNITVSIDGSAFDDDSDDRVLVVELTNADHAIAENYRTFTLNLNAQ